MERLLPLQLDAPLPTAAVSRVASGRPSATRRGRRQAALLMVAVAAFAVPVLLAMELRLPPLAMVLAASLGMRTSTASWRPGHTPRCLAARAAVAAAIAEALEEKAQAPQRPEHPSRLPLRIDDVWYDLAGWRKKHPGGAHFVDFFHGRDATEVMHAFHSVKACELLTRLPRVPEGEEPQGVPPTSEVTRNFRLLRQRLEREGWWERDLFEEAKELAIWAALVVSGVTLANAPWMVGGGWLAVIPLGLAMIQGAWLGHDYVHGTDDFARNMRLFGPLTIGLAPEWWGEKHTIHHALTNQKGADLDISIWPLFIWRPHPEDDHWMRKIQQYWFPLGFAGIFLLWRYMSLLWAAGAIRRNEKGGVLLMAALVLNTIACCFLVPPLITLAALMVQGFVCGTIISATHQTEDLFDDFQHEWVTAQFQGTRDAITRNAFTEWLWGGMQYHLEHHLFPSMPRYKYPRVRKILQQFAKENNIPGGCRYGDEVELTLKFWQNYRVMAEVPEADPTAPRMRAHVTRTATGYQLRREDLMTPS